MHERTQKAICRLAFVCLCAVPTACVLLAIVVSWTPWFHSYQLSKIEAHLTAELGLRVQVEDFERPSPSVTRLHGIVILENETGAEVGRARLATFASLEDKRILRIHQPELQSAQLQHAWQIVHDRFLCQPELTRQPMVVAADDLTLHSKSGGVTLRDTVARVHPRGKSIEAQLEFIPAGRETSTKATVSVVRDRSGPLPETHWQLYTGGIPLPCSALADYLPALRTLGAEAEFNGSLNWKMDSQGWSVDLAGARFTGVDLSEVFDGLPHKLSGRATIQLVTCKIRPGQAVDVSGSLVATGGYAGTSLLQAAHTHLGISSVSEQAVQGSLWYDLMALRFEVYGSKLTVSGDCRNHRGFESLPPGVVLASDSKPLATRNDDEAMWATNLVAALAPQHAALVPYSQQTAGLRHILVPPERPLPEGSLPAVPRITLRNN